LSHNGSFSGGKISSGGAQNLNKKRKCVIDQLFQKPIVFFDSYKEGKLFQNPILHIHNIAVLV
jgi:hypothetical protein